MPERRAAAAGVYSMGQGGDDLEEENDVQKRELQGPLAGKFFEQMHC